MGKKILIVEDDQDFAKSLSMTLSLKNHFVTVANSGEEALEKSAGEEFDTCFIDIKMPGMSGFDCLEKLKSVQPESTHYVIMTGFRDTETLSRAEDSIAKQLLLKPFSMYEFLRLAEE